MRLWPCCCTPRHELGDPHLASGQFDRIRIRAGGDVFAGGGYRLDPIERQRWRTWNAPKRRLLDWAMSVTARLETDMRTDRQDASLAATVPHRGNLRTALERQLAADRVLDALRIVTSVPVDVPAERVRLINQLVPRLGDDHADVVGRAHLAASELELARGQFESAVDHARRAAKVFERLGDRQSMAWASFFGAIPAWGLGEEARARAVVDAARRTFSEMGDRVEYANASWMSIRLNPDLEAADRLGVEAEDQLRDIGSPFALAHCLEARALVALELDRAAEARVCLAEALEIFAGSGNEGCVAHCLEAVAASIVTGSDPDSLGVAAEVLGAAESLRAVGGHRHGPWELGGERAALAVLREAFDADELEAAIGRGRGHNLPSATQLGHRALEVPT